MKCIECGNETTKHRATKDAPYQFLGSGLKNVYLAGIDVEECKACDVEYPTIPRLPELHRAIAGVLGTKQGQLSGDELRFMRKVAGFSAKDFAALLMIEPESLSRAENGSGLGAPSDKLARAIALAALGTESVKAVLLRIASDMQRIKKLEFRCDRNGWKAAA
jgi:DNA-binding transcriptional regulator YiaG